MKIILTGSLGNIGKPLTEDLVQEGHAVTVISSNPAKQNEIEALGAAAAIGNMEDAKFLTAAFMGADAVYCMTPPDSGSHDHLAYNRLLTGNYARAIRQSGVKRVVHLSSYGAELDKGTGLILGRHIAEGILDELPGISLTHMRPTYFYYNLNSFIPMIKNAGVMRANYGAEDSIVMVSPIDIAAAIAEELVIPAEELVTPTSGRTVRYVASDELTGNEIARILGAAIGKPDLKWVVVTDEQMQNGLVTNGVPPAFAADLVEMFGSIHSGVLTQDYYLNEPAVMGKVKFTEFAKEFAARYQSAAPLS